MVNLNHMNTAFTVLNNVNLSRQMAMVYRPPPPKVIAYYKSNDIHIVMTVFFFFSFVICIQCRKWKWTNYKTKRSSTEYLTKGGHHET